MSNRLIGRLPKVGIRPVIDGRERGVRESLEEQCMAMAKNAAKLIEDNLRFPSGEKVECVIADTNIGGVAEAAMCADKFERDLQRTHSRKRNQSIRTGWFFFSPER